MNIFEVKFNRVNVSYSTFFEIPYVELKLRQIIINLCTTSTRSAGDLTIAMLDWLGGPEASRPEPNSEGKAPHAARLPQPAIEVSRRSRACTTPCIAYCIFRMAYCIYATYIPHPSKAYVGSYFS